MGSIKGKIQFVIVLLDTNVIVDIALERQPYFETSQQILLLVEQERIEGCISASTVSDLYYIIRKARGQEWTLDFLNWLVAYCHIATVNEEAIQIALTTNFRDLEDAIQYATAVINHLDAIVTRNLEDFPVATPRILTPRQLMAEVTNSL
jgi:predicted nucleic acid-binding protein